MNFLILNNEILFLSYQVFFFLGTIISFIYLLFFTYV
jgi:hypothetical protein